jgi:ComF family protein
VSAAQHAGGPAYSRGRRLYLLENRHPVSSGADLARLWHVRQRAAAAANALLRLFLAPVCAACEAALDQPLSSPVCEACWRSIQRVGHPSCATCGDAIPSWRYDSHECARCRRAPPNFSRARSAGRYDGSLRHLVHAFKYERRRYLAAPLAALMREAGGDLLVGADALVPVPLHPWRAWQRGFNQADDLARHIGLPVWRPLARRRLGTPQADLPAARRSRNVREAFGLAALPPVWPPAASWRTRLAGRTIVLIDDVMTTGATLNACARVLGDAGVRDVRALTVARAAVGPPATPPRQPRPSVPRR